MCVQRRMTWKAAAVCLSIMVVGCASSSRPSREAARATALATPTPSTTDVAQSPSWQDEGTTLKKADLYDYSYESLPVDVNGPGPQTLDIGPVDSSFSLNTQAAYIYTLPPDAHFGVNPFGFTMTTINGERYIEMQARFLGSNPSYHGFRLWFSVSLAKSGG
jgi:hypothetical protein